MEKRKLFFLLIVFIVICCFIYSDFLNTFLKSKSSILKQKQLKAYTEDHKDSSLKYVLFYTHFWRNKNWHIGKETVGSEHHHFDTCSVKNCVFTNKKRYLKNYEDYDALIFHNGQGWKVNGKYWRIPEVRKPNQLYIIAVQE